MSVVVCPSGHEAMKADRVLLIRRARYAGLQEDGEGGAFELWTCEHCGSTISAEPLPRTYDAAMRAWAVSR